MTADDLTCFCGHRFALHTYFSNTTPCTRCGCRSYDETRSGRREPRQAASQSSPGTVESPSRPPSTTKRRIL
jgi:hypothetical protein